MLNLTTNVKTITRLANLNSSDEPKQFAPHCVQSVWKGKSRIPSIKTPPFLFNRVR